jgi:hypothetical protein
MKTSVGDVESLRDEFHTFKVTVNERLNISDARVDYLYTRVDQIKESMEMKFDVISQKVKTIETSSKNNYKLIIGSLILIFLFILIFVNF